jgi:hypothetical protein
MAPCGSGWDGSSAGFASPNSNRKGSPVALNVLFDQNDRSIWRESAQKNTR